MSLTFAQAHKLVAKTKSNDTIKFKF
uniref:Uncharacterized protein n=1 Tax=Rhizophora mucronata TaxID=61149 RepID=A0A2P2PJJ4_RHIMU